VLPSKHQKQYSSVPIQPSCEDLSTCVILMDIYIMYWKRNWHLCVYLGLPLREKNNMNIDSLIKGSVQQKLSWVENGVNRSVGASDCGAGHSFVVLFRFHFDFTYFRFRTVLPNF
jgi:hypothetical protein